MSVLDVGQDMGRTLLAVDVIAAVQERLEAAGAVTELHVFHRLSRDELELLVWQEAHA